MKIRLVVCIPLMIILLVSIILLLFISSSAGALDGSHVVKPFNQFGGIDKGRVVDDNDDPIEDGDSKNIAPLHIRGGATSSRRSEEVGDARADGNDAKETSSDDNLAKHNSNYRGKGSRESHLLASAPSQLFSDLLLTYDTSGAIPTSPFSPERKPDTSFYLKEAEQVAERMRSQWLQNQDSKTLRKKKKRSATPPDEKKKGVAAVDEQSVPSSNARPEENDGYEPVKPFRFHVYQIPDKYIHETLGLLSERWTTSFCNRHKKKTNYTNLDWRHAHSLFTADILISKYLQFHPSHTLDPNEADIFIIPMMTHAYNCAGTMFYAIDILSWVTQFPYYKLYNNHDHYFFWWRWGMHFKSVERLWKRIVRHFPNANIISFDFLELMGRNEWQDFSLALKPKFLQAQHWIVMPYPDFSPDLALPNGEQTLRALALAHPSERVARDVSLVVYEKRKIFFYFAGTSTIGGIRRWIKRNCDARSMIQRESEKEARTTSKEGRANSDTKSEDGVSESTADKNLCFYEDFATSVIDAARLGIPSGYPAKMKNSLFCGHAAGDALSSRRPTSAVMAGCIPVMICDLCLYAFEDVIDYSGFSVFVSEDDVIEGRLMEILEAISPAAIRRMQENLVKVRHYFVYNISGPPSKGDALDTLVDTLAVRGRVLRSYRRWWTANHRLAPESYAYPKDPPPIKKYLRKGVSSAEEEKNFNNI